MVPAARAAVPKTAGATTIPCNTRRLGKFKPAIDTSPVVIVAPTLCGVAHTLRGVDRPLSITQTVGCVRHQQGSETMPEVYVHAIEGRSKDQKRALIKDITDAVVKNFGVTADAVLVEIIETSRDNKAKGGVLFSER